MVLPGLVQLKIEHLQASLTSLVPHLEWLDQLEAYLGFCLFLQILLLLKASLYTYSVYIYIYPSLYYLSIIYLSIYSSIHPFTHSSMHPPIHPSGCSSNMVVELLYMAATLQEGNNWNYHVS